MSIEKHLQEIKDYHKKHIKLCIRDLAKLEKLKKLDTWQGKNLQDKLKVHKEILQFCEDIK